MSDAPALVYDPHPLGTPQARAAVCHYYREHGAELAQDQICLTTSTSEAYSFVFRLLCNPGDEVLIAQPSYPLFDLLAQVQDVVLRPYPLVYEPAGGGFDGRWTVDLRSVEDAINPRTRAVVLVHPNNPTGNFVSPEERAALVDLCASRGLALIVDEVFLDYFLQTDRNCRTFLQGPMSCLCFVLSGISKICALPQMKLSWAAVTGPPALVAEAMRRLEIIADTFLSVSAPAQYALPTWLGSRHSTQDRIRERLRDNREVLDQVLQGSLGNALTIEGGWTAVLRVPAYVGGEPFALAAMQAGVLVQPGPFYGLSAGHCVVSLLTPPEDWERGLLRLPLFHAS